MKADYQINKAKVILEWFCVECLEKKSIITWLKRYYSNHQLLAKSGLASADWRYK